MLDPSEASRKPGDAILAAVLCELGPSGSPFRLQHLRKLGQTARCNPVATL
jgi:hypothetical protein